MAKLNMSKELDSFCKVAIDAAIDAGQILLRYQKKISKLKVHAKEAQGVMSEADLKSEQKIISILKKSFPTHEILAEESAFDSLGGELDAYKFFKQKNWCWCIDPLDGTNNFLGGMDYYAVCISLLHRGKPVVGVVLRPATNEVYYAVSGKGARYRSSNGSDQKLVPKKVVSKLKDTLLVTGFASEKGVLCQEEFITFQQILLKSRGVRRMGSAALDMCLLSQGIFDGFWERGLAPWDVAASGIIAIEAGVKVSDWNGRSFHPFQNTIIAARTPIYGQLRRQLS